MSRVVLDHLTTHNPAALYEPCPPAEAHRLRQKLEFHDPPKPGSWLTRAASELSVLARQCLQRRLATQATLKRELAAVEAPRTVARATVNWQFTIVAARVKLHHLYPSTSL